MGTDILVAVHQLHLQTRIADCWLVTESELESRVKLSVPVDMLQLRKEAAICSKADKQVLVSAAATAFQATVLNMKDPAYRRDYRVMQLRLAIMREVTQVLKSRTFHRLFNLGPINVEFDPSIFDLKLPTKTSSVFNYKEGSIGHLDSLLGDKWDIKCEDGRVLFVTCLRAWLTVDSCIHASVWSACVVYELTEPEYRKQLHQYAIRKAPAIEQVASVGDATVLQ